MQIKKINRDSSLELRRQSVLEGNFISNVPSVLELLSKKHHRLSVNVKVALQNNSLNKRKSSILLNSRF